MKHCLIMVEGAHDIAVIEKLLRVNGINQKINSEMELPQVWKRTIPSSYPFDGDRLERISPIPSFVKNDNISVAIKNAGSDKDIMPVLLQVLKIMDIKEVMQLNSIMLIFDADQQSAEIKKRKMLEVDWSGENFKFDTDQMELTAYGKNKIPIYTFIFPDNVNPGNLEQLLLETASIAYPELLVMAEDYINKAATLQSTLKREQDKNKAKVGCIANVMKPGKANQISIADNDWVSKKTIESCRMLGKLNDEITKMCSL